MEEAMEWHFYDTDIGYDIDYLSELLMLKVLYRSLVAFVPQIYKTSEMTKSKYNRFLYDYKTSST